MRLRFATLEDTEALFHLLLGLHQEQAAVPLNPIKADGQLRHSIEHDVVLVAEHEGKLIGSICLRTWDFWYSDAQMLIDKWFYVDPKYRRLGTAKKLIDAAKKWAREVDMRLTLAIASPNRLKAKMRLLRRWGFYVMAAHMMEGR